MSLPAVDADNSSINKPSPKIGIGIKIKIVINKINIGRIVNKFEVNLIDVITL